MPIKKTTNNTRKASTTKTNKPYKGQANLDVIFGSTEDTKTDSSYLPLTEIVLPPQQPRRYFDADKLAQLTTSIKQYGVLENLLVRPLPNGKYELVAGERRYRASFEAGLIEVPVTIKELSDESALEIALVENLQREDLNPIEATEGILLLLAQKLLMSESEIISLLYKMNNESKKNSNHNVMVNPEIALIEQIFEEVGLMSWQSFVVNRLPLLNLPKDILDSLRQGKIAYTKAHAIAKIKDQQTRINLLSEAINSNLSLREIKERIKQLQSQPKLDSPLQRIEGIVKQINQAKLWEKEPKKWQKVQQWLSKIEDILQQ